MEAKNGVAPDGVRSLDVLDMAMTSTLLCLGSTDAVWKLKRGGCMWPTEAGITCLMELYRSYPAAAEAFDHFQFPQPRAWYQGGFWPRVLCGMWSAVVVVVSKYGMTRSSDRSRPQLRAALCGWGRTTTDLELDISLCPVRPSTTLLKFRFRTGLPIQPGIRGC